MLRFQRRSCIVPWNDNWSSWAYRHNRRFLPCIHKRPRVNKLVGKRLDKEWQVQVLRVLTMKNCNRQGIVEKLSIHTITWVNCIALKLVDVFSLWFIKKYSLFKQVGYKVELTNEDVHESIRSLSMLRNEKREIFIFAQRTRNTQIWNACILHRNPFTSLN